MKFLIIEKYGGYTVDAEDFEEAVGEAYDNHTGYKNVYAIVKIEEDNDE